MMWQPEIETMPREQMQTLQLARLQDAVRRVYANVPYYAAKMDAIGIKPDDIRTLDDLQNLPFTTKQDLRDTYPFGLFAVPQDQVIRVHASSGTTGKPTVVGYTAADIAIWSEVMARSLYAAGITGADTLQIAYGYGLFTGGLGVHYGGETIGARVVPMSSGNTQKQITLMQDFGATALACTPSYALNLAEALQDANVMDKIKLRAGLFGAEPWSQGMRKQLEQQLNIRATDIYGIAEIIGPGVSVDCEHQCGQHIFTDHFLPEIINPDTGAVLPEGQEGELVFTCITKQALPLIRYRTRDLSLLDYAPCTCGRTLPRMQRVHDRSDDMLIIRGINVFPSQIQYVLTTTPGATLHYHIVVDRVKNADTLEVQVELPEDMAIDTVSAVEDLRRRIAHNLQNVLGLSVLVTLVEPRSLQRSIGKAVRVSDLRK